ncbi:MAG: glutamine-hydrolyzing carbamoyl-phosphate synthase small subunit [Candidatus Omnitrophica bacterium]|nr:glutamine-hydrolyzing carbamoyl-phosphate synthase small subunit [Candidatus Omnitrophota bacterium]
MKAILMLEDQKTFTGTALAGASGERIGEVMFNTAVVGYQEMLTDPANAGKILVFTYPLIGNYGIAPKFSESKKAWVQAAVIKEQTRIYSNWQATGSFDDFVKENKLLVLAGIDTRALAVHLRQKGQMLGIISTTSFDPKELSRKLENFRRKPAQSFVAQVSVEHIRPLGKPSARQKKVAVLDLGVTQSFIRQLEAAGAHVTLVPYNASTKDILGLKAHGLVISDGPEQDQNLRLVEQNVKPLVGKLPILGVSCGFQVLAECLGAKVFKMRLGHHGVNYPIHDPASYKGEITVQNHSFVVDADSLAKRKDTKITAYNLNDRTVEEIESRKLRVTGVQYSPVSPGLGEINPVILKFMKTLKRRN